MLRIYKIFPVLTILSSVSCLGLCVYPALAEERKGDAVESVAPAAGSAMTVRGKQQDDYTRLVFESAQSIPYKATYADHKLTLVFDKPVTLKVAGDTVSTLARIKAYDVVDARTVRIAVVDGQDVRHFTLGKKIIVDVKGKMPAASSVDKGDEKPPVASAPEISPDKKVVESVSSEEKKAVDSEVHHIQLASTEQINIAAFERAGRFWIVVDQPDYPVPVQIDGPHASSFKPFEVVPLKEATAFWTTLPDHIHRSAEGGGLIWKFTLSEEESAQPHKPLERRAVQDNAPEKKVTAGNYLLWPVIDAQKIVEMEDPVVGDIIKIVTVQNAADAFSKRQSFPELMVLPSMVGLAIVPKIDDLDVQKTADGVTLTRAGSALSISPEEDVLSFKDAKDENGIASHSTDKNGAVSAAIGADSSPKRATLFDFSRWMMGGEKALEENVQVIMGGIGLKNDQGQAADLMLLGKMELANGHGPEAIGYFDVSEQKVPELAGSSEYKALRGAAQALMGKYDSAFQDLADASLNGIAEAELWRAYTLAGLEDWDQAAKVLPADVSMVDKYPDPIRLPMELVLTEVALREGDVDLADEFLRSVTADEAKLLPSQQAALTYLKGEYARQNNKLDETKKHWDSLAKGVDDLYRAKAGLALVTLLTAKKELSPAQAIDRLESLRYAWRGDELETAVNFRLGQMYVDSGDYLRGFATLRHALTISPESEQSRKIGVYMADTFRNLFLTNKIQSVSPLDAVTVFEEFPDLIPAGPDADKIVQALAERLVEVDLLPRAATMLRNLSEQKLKGMDAVRTMMRVGQIELMDGNPNQSISSMNKVDTLLSAFPVEQAAPVRRDVAMMRARALSALKKPEEAFEVLKILDQNKDVLRLRAEIAWQAQRWQDAAESLELLIGQEDISLTRPLSDLHADMLLNWAVALYLADNRYVLANVRERYSDAMAQTAQAKKFEVVTRPRQSTLLADRDTINAIVSEIELFKDFMDVTAKKSADQNQSGKTPEKTKGP